MLARCALAPPPYDGPLRSNGCTSRAGAPAPASGSSSPHPTLPVHPTLLACTPASGSSSLHPTLP
eukprot:5938431-Prymnesium_polylepis.1